MSLEGLNGLVNRITAWADRLQRKHGVLGFPYAVLKKYGDDEGGRQAALITYYGFLSIFPLLLLGVAVLSRVLADHPDLRQRLITASVPEALQSTVEHSLTTLPTSTIPFVAGLAGLLLSGTGVVFSAYQTLNHVAAVRFRLTVRPGIRGAGDAAGRSGGSRCAHGGGHRAARRVRCAAGGRGAWLGAGRLRGAAAWCEVAAGAARSGPGALAGRRLGRGGGDGRAQRGAAAAGQAGGQGRPRLRQLRHRGGHVRPAVPGRSGAGVCGRSGSRPLCPAVATRPGPEPPHCSRRPCAGPAGLRAGTHPRRPG